MTEGQRRKLQGLKSLNARYVEQLQRDDVMAVAFDTCFVDKDGQNAILLRG